MKISKLILAVLLFAFLTPALAYIGPGAGIPFIGSFIGFIVTIVLVISAILFWPIRKILKNRKKNIENKKD
jgi:hypothetical protein